MAGVVSVRREHMDAWDHLARVAWMSWDHLGQLALWERQDSLVLQDCQALVDR